ncbi:MAG: hypothetical protein JW874_09565 [Spirochaetales bacterium]|nr:hypothetical protein [Spirochaetales bacterium]
MKKIVICLLVVIIAFGILGCASTSGAAKPAAGGGSEIVLKGKDATLHTDPKMPALTIEEPNGNIGYWDKIEEYPSWDVNIPKAGKYLITLRYAAWSSYAGSSFELEIDGQKIEGTFVRTSSNDDGYFAWKNLDIGVVDLTAGDKTLTIKVTKMVSFAAANILKLTLTPQ